MEITLDLYEVLHVVLRRGWTLSYRGTRTPGVLEHDERPTSFVLTHPDGSTLEGLTLSEVMKEYVRVQCRLG